MDEQTMIQAVRQHAMRNYENGWDTLVECYSDGDVLEAIGDAKTIEQAIANAAAYLGVPVAAARLLESVGEAVAALREAEVLLEASYLDHEGTDNGKAIFSGLEHVREVLAKLEGGAPAEPVKRPRVVIEVRGGVADYTVQGAVDVELRDYDNEVAA